MDQMQSYGTYCGDTNPIHAMCEGDWGQYKNKLILFCDAHNCLLGEHTCFYMLWRGGVHVLFPNFEGVLIFSVNLAKSSPVLTNEWSLKTCIITYYAYGFFLCNYLVCDVWIGIN